LRDRDYGEPRMPRRSAPPKAVSALRSATPLQKVGGGKAGDVRWGREGFIFIEH